MFYRKSITNEMTQDIYNLWVALKEAFQADLKSSRVDWMEEETREYALQKLEAMRFAVLSFEPNNFEEEFSQLQFNEHNYMENLIALLHSKGNRSRAAVHEPPQPEDEGYEQSYVPSYAPIDNLLKVPVSLVYQYHKFASSYPKALNFGSMGVFIGHEMLHGFDDAGRKYDAKGNTRNWWQPRCTSEFQKRTECFINQYHNFTLKDGQQLPLMKLQAENIADNGGVRAAYAAYMEWYEKNMIKNPQVAQTSELLTGLNYTHQQLFFINYGQIWCTSYQDSYISTTYSVHAPHTFRAFAPLANFDEFARVFQCAEGSRMNPVERCEIY